MSASAQQRVGFVGGLNLANLDAVDKDGDIFDPNLSNRTVFGLGGILDLSLRRNISLRLEPMYLQKGAKQEDIGIRFELAYFEMPVFLKLTFESSTIQPYLMAGPSLGLILRSRFVSPEVELNVIDALNSIDFGLGFGAGVSLPIGKNAIFVEGRYTLGLANIADEGKASDGVNEFEIEERTVFETRGIQIMLGITFPFGRY